ncbi:MAG: hypothetical protein A2V90_01090 [Gammaproteobacteria bacterium RBG_16_57_12]|nr:MAG: hypothetical protein A2V90_01090 [Gammaproteobacteria bacterium RBG_16_57_12]
MTDHTTEDNTEIPKWDVALEALVREEFEHQGAALRNEDFLRLAKQYTIRYDDIMDTVFRLVIDGQWRYLDAAGIPQAINQDQLDRMYESGRLKEADLREFSGYWSPV